MADDVTLVTGASGFLGKAVMKLLADISQRAIGLDPRPSATTQVVDNLSDRAKLKALLATEKVTHIIHAGGVSGPMVLADDPARSHRHQRARQLEPALRRDGSAAFRLSSIARRRPRSAVSMKTTPVDEQYPLRPEQHLQRFESRDGDGAAWTVGQNSA